VHAPENRNKNENLSESRKQTYRRVMKHGLVLTWGRKSYSLQVARPDYMTVSWVSGNNCQEDLALVVGIISLRADLPSKII
jgi:hypothetical protein